MRFRKYFFIVFPALFAGGAILLLGHGTVPASTDPRTAAPRVNVATVRQEDASFRAFTGVVTARIVSDQGFRVAGKITRRLVEVGDHVRSGQPLMLLDASDYVLDVTAQQGQLEDAHARLVQARLDFERLNTLVGRKVVAIQDHERALTEMKRAEAQLAAAEARLKVAQNEHAYTTLMADTDGVVVDISAEQGQVVDRGQIVVRIAGNGPREAYVSLPETLRPALGSTARAVLYGGESVEGQAVLRELSVSADPVTRTFGARYVLQDALENASLGTTVVVRIERPAMARMVVPLSALYDRGDGFGVWAVNAQTSTVSFRPVHVAEIAADEAFVAEGLQVGERIVAQGAHLLYDDAVVRVSAGQDERQ